MTEEENTVPDNAPEETGITLSDERDNGLPLSQEETTGTPEGDESTDEITLPSTDEKTLTQKEVNSLMKRERQRLESKMQAQFQDKINELTEKLVDNNQRYADNGLQSPAHQEGHAYGRPTVDDLEMAFHQFEKRKYQKQYQADQMRMQSEQLQRDEKFQDALETGNSRFPDFDAVVRADGVPFTHDMLESVKFEQDPGAILFNAAKHYRNDLLRIAHLPRELQAREMAILGHQIKTSISRRLQSNAPAPVTQERSAGAGSLPSTINSFNDMLEYDRQRFLESRR